MPQPIFWALLRKEWLVLRRDPQGLAVLFLMPTIFILVMALALRDAMDPEHSDARQLLWLDEDQGYFAQELRDRFARRGSLELLPVQDRAALDSLSVSGAAAAVRIPAGLSARLSAEPPQPLLQVLLDPTFEAIARERLLAELRGELLGLKAEFIAEDMLGLPEAEAAYLREALRPEAVHLRTVVGSNPEDDSRKLPDATQQSVPAWIVFAMFFVILPLSTSVIGERGTGTLQRLTLIGASPARLLLAKVPLYLLITLIQALLMLSIGAWVVPWLGGAALDIQGQWLSLLPITLASGFAAIGVALLIAALASSAVQATTIGGATNLLLGAISGVMVPRAVMPDALELLGLISPMAWALDGYWDIILRQSPMTATLPECGALLLLGGACMLVAARGLRMENG